MSTNINPNAGNTNGINIFKQINGTYFSLEKFEIISRSKDKGGDILKISLSKTNGVKPIVLAMSVKKVLKSIDFFEIDMDPFVAAIKIVIEFGVEYDPNTITNIA
jgi:hypothetical protein